VTDAGRAPDEDWIYHRKPGGAAGIPALAALAAATALAAGAAPAAAVGLEAGPGGHPGRAVRSGPAGVISTVAGGVGGPARATQVLIQPCSISFGAGHLYIVEATAVRAVGAQTDWLTPGPPRRRR